jgi:cell division protein FtsW
LALIWRGFHISVNAKNLYGSLVGTAVTTMLGAQILINIGVVVGWMPSKGLVLPFMSYGASAVVAYLICIGLLLRISSESDEEPTGYAVSHGGQSP